MAENTENYTAKTIFNDLCNLLDKKEWKYGKHEEDLVVTCAAVGEDLPMDLIIAVDEETKLLRVFSRLPFLVPEDKRIDLAIATCIATYDLPDGSFDYDIATGKIVFRMTASYRESRIGEKLFDYLLHFSFSVIDKYNDQFFAICKGAIGIGDFINSRNK